MMHSRAEQDVVPRKPPHAHGTSWVAPNSKAGPGLDQVRARLCEVYRQRGARRAHAFHHFSSPFPFSEHAFTSALKDSSDLGSLCPAPGYPVRSPAQTAQQAHGAARLLPTSCSTSAKQETKILQHNRAAKLCPCGTHAVTFGGTFGGCASVPLMLQLGFALLLQIRSPVPPDAMH